VSGFPKERPFSSYGEQPTAILLNLLGQMKLIWIGLASMSDLAVGFTFASATRLRA
jgi:hypothetical protein